MKHGLFFFCKIKTKTKKTLDPKNKNKKQKFNITLKETKREKTINLIKIVFNKSIIFSPELDLLHIVQAFP